MSIESFRSDLRRFERGIDKLNKSCCFVGLTLPQCHLMMEIGANNSLSATHLAERLNLDKSTISRGVDKLVKSGFLNREIPNNDRRSVNISLTSKGIDFYNEINLANNQHFENIFEKVNPQELQTFRKVFHEISLLI